MPASQGVVSLILSWLGVSRRLSDLEKEEWGSLKDFCMSPEWDSAFGSLESASKFEIVEQMADINEALSSAIRVRDSGFDWVVSSEGDGITVSSLKVDRREARFLVEIFLTRLEVLSELSARY